MSTSEQDSALQCAEGQQGHGQKLQEVISEILTVVRTETDDLTAKITLEMCSSYFRCYSKVVYCRNSLSISSITYFIVLYTLFAIGGVFL